MSPFVGQNGEDEEQIARNQEGCRVQLAFPEEHRSLHTEGFVWGPRLHLLQGISRLSTISFSDEEEEVEELFCKSKEVV